MHDTESHRYERWLALAGYSALTLVFTYPLSRHPGSTSLGSDPDVHLFTWILGWVTHALVHQPWAIFDANIFFPLPRTLAFSEHLIGNALFAAPVIWLTGNYVLAMNVVALASVALCGMGAFVLARQLRLSVPAAILCGLVFAFSPARFFRFQQLHLSAIQWIPFALASLHAYLERGRPRDLKWAVAFSTLQALSSLHGAVYLVVAVALVGVHAAVRRTPLMIIRRGRDAGMAGVVALLVAMWMAVPYFRVQREMGLVRTLENWIPAPESFLASPTHVHRWVMAWFGDATINDRASAFLFPGYLPVLLGVVALARNPRGWPPFLPLYAFVVAIGVLLTMGPPFGLWPYVYWWPVLNFIRVPSRFFLLAVLGVAVLAGFGTDRVLSRLRPRAAALSAGALALMLIVECAALPLSVTPYSVRFDGVERWLSRQPTPFAVAEVPVAPLVRYHSTYMLHSMAHWQKTVHGHSGLLAPLHEKIYEQLRYFPDEQSLEALSDLNVTYVVVHPDLYQPGEWERVDRALSTFAPRLTVVYGDLSGRVYRLQR